MVELLIVVVIIAILVAITATMYQNAQVQARDTQIKDAADKFADAISLWSANHSGAKPKGGWATAGSNSLNAAKDDCVAGANGFQAYKTIDVSTTYDCTVGDVMVSSGYLTAPVFNNLPINTAYTTNRYVFMIYPCTNNANHWILSYSLEDPTSTDTANYNQIHTGCATPVADLSFFQTNGMRGAILIKFA